MDFFFKVVVDLGEGEQPQKLAREICRQIEKIYGVREAELSSYLKHGDE
jgi:hypothetical protein